MATSPCWLHSHQDRSERRFPPLNVLLQSQAHAHRRVLSSHDARIPHRITPAHTTRPCSNTHSAASFFRGFLPRGLSDACPPNSAATPRHCHAAGILQPLTGTADPAPPLADRFVLLLSRFSALCELIWLAGKPMWPEAPPARRASDFSLLGDLQGVVDLDAEVTDCAFEFGVTQEQLDSP